METSLLYVKEKLDELEQLMKDETSIYVIKYDGRDIVSKLREEIEKWHAYPTFEDLSKHLERFSDEHAGIVIHLRHQVDSNGYGKIFIQLDAASHISHGEIQKSLENSLVGFRINCWVGDDGWFRQICEGLGGSWTSFQKLENCGR